MTATKMKDIFEKDATLYLDSNTLDGAQGPEIFYVEPVIPGLRAEKENPPPRVRAIGGIFMEQTSSNCTANLELKRSSTSILTDTT